MLQRCPHCQAEQTEQADGSRTCAQCGTPAEMPLFTFAPLNSKAFAENTPRSAAPDAPSGPEARRPVVHGLSWKIATALVILAVTGLSLRPFQPHLATRPSAADASPITASPAAPAALPAPSLPSPPPSEALSIALQSSPAAPTVTVGKAVTLAATATTIPGRPTTITVFYQQNQGPELLLAQTQGTQCRASWIPARPGEYSFTATAREDQARVAQAAPLTFHVAAAPKMAVSPVVLSQAPHIVVPQHVWAVSRPRILPAVKPAVKNLVKTAGKRPVLPSRFHVAAALLPVEHSAAILAAALHRHGYPAVVRPRSNGAGNQRYVVQTGVFSSAPAARRQSQQLQHDGYPAFTYRTP